MSEAKQVLQQCTSDAGCLHVPESAPFEIAVSLSGNWATLECDVGEHVGSDTAARLDAVVRRWVDWVNGSDSAHDPSNRGDVAQVSEPVRGADFVQWHMQLHLAEPQRLNVLVNAFVRLYHRGVDLRGLYIG